MIAYTLHQHSFYLFSLSGLPLKVFPIQFFTVLKYRTNYSFNVNLLFLIVQVSSQNLPAKALQIPYIPLFWMIKPKTPACNTCPPKSIVFFGPYFGSPTMDNQYISYEREFGGCGLFPIDTPPVYIYRRSVQSLRNG